MPKQTPKDTHKTRKPPFPELETQKKHFSKKNQFFPEKSHSAELSACKSTFSLVEISYESGSVLFDQMKVSEKNAQSRKNAQLLSKFFKHAQDFFYNKKHKSVKIPKFFVLDGMGSLVFEPPLY